MVRLYASVSSRARHSKQTRGAMDIGIYISIGTAAAVLAYVVRATWSARGIETDIRKDMNEYRQIADAQLEKLHRDVSQMEGTGVKLAETLRHEFGETGQALRTKIHEIETWNRDTFVRKDSFEAAIARIEKTTENAVNKIDKRLDIMFEWVKQNSH